MYVSNESGRFSLGVLHNVPPSLLSSPLSPPAMTQKRQSNQLTKKVGRSRSNNCDQVSLVLNLYYVEEDGSDGKTAAETLQPAATSASVVFPWSSSLDDAGQDEEDRPHGLQICR